MGLAILSRMFKSVIFIVSLACVTTSCWATEPNPVLLAIRNPGGHKVGLLDRYLGFEGQTAFRKVVDKVAPGARVLPIDVQDLNAVETKARTLLKENDIIVGAFLFGHGETKQFSFDNKTKVTGDKMASFVQRWTNSLPTSPVFFLEFLSCNLGYVSGDRNDGFAEVLAQGLQSEKSEIHILSFPFVTESDASTSPTNFEMKMIERINLTNYQMWRPVVNQNIIPFVLFAGVWLTDWARFMYPLVTNGNPNPEILNQAVNHVFIAGGLAIAYNGLTKFKRKVIRELVAGQGSVIEGELTASYDTMVSTLKAAVTSAGCKKALSRSE